jgi:hypothetical protein
MDEKLTNECAEMIGQYIKGGKEVILTDLLQKGGIVRKGIQKNGGRIPGRERVFYYHPDGTYACYDPTRLKILNKLKEQAEALKNSSK